MIVRVRFLRCFAFLVISIAGVASAGLDDGLVAHYPFDGNANDISGNGYHGNVMGPTLTPGQDGVANSAYQFDGSNDRIDLPRQDW